MQCTRDFAQPYAMPRLPSVAKRGMVATSQPSAAQAGIAILRLGGNAIDAAVATAAALTVVEPTSNGIGADAFALVWNNGTLHGLNASGPAPKSISPEALITRGFTSIPLIGWEPVTVPGAPAAWAELSRRFGRLPLSETLEPAIELAQQGFAVPPTLANLWSEAFASYAKILTGEQFRPWFETFAPLGRAPRCGETWKSEAHARTLTAIGETGGEAFYRGELADKIDAFSRQFGGFIRKEDLASFELEWVQPISTDYRGYDVWEMPPNGQGLSVLMALNILREFPPVDRDDEWSVHRMIEAVKLSMTDGRHHITDPCRMRTEVADLLSRDFARSRAALIGEIAIDPVPKDPVRGGTVYLATADDEGNMVSYIQSNYEGFGSGLVVPGTGIALQDRGANFSLDPAHVNCIGAGKRTFHTIIPGFISQAGSAIGPFGVMGGFNQPQGHVQVITNLIDCHLDVQAALDAPRWRWLKQKKIIVEPHLSPYITKALARRGHQVRTSMDQSLFGRGQIIYRDSETGAFFGGTESRTDGLAAVL